MSEEQRKQAIQRYSQGEKPKSIYTSLNCSKEWFFKWLKRYNSGVPEWYKEQSRTPLRKLGQIPDDQKQAIILTRTRLEAQSFAQTGVSAIKWELSKQGLLFLSNTTINRLLKRECLVKKNFVCSQRG